MVDIPVELAEAIALGNAVLFVGAGLSVGAGLASWNQLLTPLADRISLPTDMRADPLKVAQYYENEYGRFSLLNHIRTQTDTHGKQPTDNHHRLLQLDIGTWVTTNYDDLIEQTLINTGKRFNKVVRDNQLPFTSADALTLIKLHGDRDQPDTIIITRQDYNTYFRRFPRVREKLSSLLTDKTFLFVGFGLNDPDFDQIHTEVAFDLDQQQRTAYAVLFDANKFFLQDMRARGFHIFNLRTTKRSNRSKLLGSFLDDLILIVNRYR